MKKYIYVLAVAALLAACQQKTETVAPAASSASTPEATTSAAEMPTPTPAESQLPAGAFSGFKPTPTP
jgi:PBP1b-binding outer membrane lipoprotein LpoB